MKFKQPDLTRRSFLATLARQLLAAGLASAAWFGCARNRSASRSALKTRGIVLVPEDLSLADWPERAKRAGLTTVALHHGLSPRAVVKLIQSERGQQFLEKCQRLDLQVEFELHAMTELLPRELFAKAPSLFRVNEAGARVPDANLCVHSAEALEIVAENALALAKTLRPTTGRYFFWGDDGQPWCRCERCREFSDSDQALILENHLHKTLRKADPRAQLAHLAYANTITPPRQIKPSGGIFLEFAPINRRYDVPYAQQSGPGDRDGLAYLDANLAVFPPATAQILEYWLDVSRASGWKRPGMRLPWARDIFLSDVATYRSRGVGHITSFGAWIDADYVRRHGEPIFLDEYGAGLTG